MDLTLPIRPGTSARHARVSYAVTPSRYRISKRTLAAQPGSRSSSFLAEWSRYRAFLYTKVNGTVIASDRVNDLIIIAAKIRYFYWYHAVRICWLGLYTASGHASLSTSLDEPDM